MIEAQADICDNYNVASQIWTELMDVLNKSSKLTRNFLKTVCKVKEMHPMMEEFKEGDTPVTLLHRFETCLKEGDEVFKKEGGVEGTKGQMQKKATLIMILLLLLDSTRMEDLAMLY